MASTSSLMSAVLRRLEGKVALITGGASGIGECTAKVFAHHGAKVVIADIQDELGHSVSQTIGQNNCIYVHCDVTDENQVKNAVDRAVEAFGKLDIMLNNAGVIDDDKPRIIDNEKADFERVMSVNVTGVFLGIKHAARVMIPRRSGSIIATASVSSFIAGANSHAYTCSKHAVVGLTRNAAVELGQFGIRVNCLSPYGVATPMAMASCGLDEVGLENLLNSAANLKGVTLKAEDVANAALFLASEEGRYVSGHNLLIDGGFSVVNPSFQMFQYPD
ncbi:Short-chain dehydrogenase/reductase [Parasponia andersonii]|uniref:Short-chain dehydrogenase/reductase n=1 Tax=Parasponia andersonii TaxID=3476 RepID=A0A2P5B4J0_PARAD|nr:Short-chain dehydrogenase/reductase [Parasponia andersonii]